MNYKQILAFALVFMMISPMLVLADDSTDRQTWYDKYYTDGTSTTVPSEETVSDDSTEEVEYDGNNDVTVDDAESDDSTDDAEETTSDSSNDVVTYHEIHPYEYNPENKNRYMNTFQQRYGDQSLYYDSEYVYYEENGRQYVFDWDDLDSDKQEKLQEYFGSTQYDEDTTIATVDGTEIEIQDLMYDFDEEAAKNQENKKIVINVEEMNAEIEEMNKDEEIKFKKAFIRTSDISKYDNIVVVEKYDDGYIIEFPVTEMGKIASNDYTLKVVDEHSIKEVREQEQEEIKEQYQEANAEREALEVTPSEIKEAKEIAIVELEKQGITITETDGNPFSFYFTSEGNLPTTSTPEEAFEIASDIVYIHDIDLWGTNEKWIPVDEVFTITPTLATNPTGFTVSDCEEHAMTFVALCREQGVPSTHVRVVTGLVEINDEKFGHAWAQIINEDGLWQNIEATSGNYIEDGVMIPATSIPYDYYEHRDYPAVEIWSCFNDEYYVDDDGGNAPADWEITATSYAVGSTVTMTWYDDVYIFIDWIENEMYKITN